MSVERLSIAEDGSGTGSGAERARGEGRASGEDSRIRAAAPDYSTLTTSVRAKSSPTNSNGQSCNLATS